MLPGFSRRFIAVAGTCLLVAACATPPTGERVTSRGERFPYKGGSLSLTQTGADCEVTLAGEITPATVSALTLVGNEITKRNCRDKTIVFDGADGQVGSAITIGSMLRNRGFNTRIAAGTTCLTPCLLAFAAGGERRVPAGARLAFSQIPPDEDYNTGRCETTLDNRQLMSLSRYLRAMLPEPAGDLMMRELRAADCRGPRPLPTGDALAAGIVNRS